MDEDARKGQMTVYASQKGWWDSTAQHQYVNRNVVSTIQRDKLFDIVSKIAPGPIGFDIGGPGFSRNGVKVMGLNIVPGCDIVADACELPFKDESIDFMVSSHSMEHVKNVWMTLREMLRVLKKGGYIAIIMPDLRHFVHSDGPDIAEPDLAPNEMVPEQMKAILSRIVEYEYEILTFDSNRNNFDFDILLRKKEES